MSDYLIINTPLGQVKGRKCQKTSKIPKETTAKEVYRFAGIPFAKPPVGELRFENPQKCEPWEGVLDGTKLKNSPMQSEAMVKGLEPFCPFTNEFNEDINKFDEDCLYLKIYTSNPDAKMPVMVWFYGGGFHIGTNGMYDGSILSSFHDVVVVIPNYRVNIFGLLSFPTGETSCNGNMGLMDQAMALQWIHENIESFGGDPKNVTIFGQSAGASSVNLHLISDVSRKYFHRAISHSGVFDDMMLVRKNNSEVLSILAKKLEVDPKDSKKLMKKLKSIPAKEILSLNDEVLAQMKYFSIVIDGQFLKEKTSETLKKRSFYKVPYMLGVCSTEGYGLMAPCQDKGFGDGITEEDGKGAIKGIFSMISKPENVDKCVDDIWKEYKKDFDESDKLLHSKIAADIVGDYYFNIASIRFSKAFSEIEDKTFFYRMSQKLCFSHKRDFNLSENPLKADICECDHGDDIFFTFGAPFTDLKFSFDVKFDEEERKMSENWMKYLVNFAYTGNPNKGPYNLSLFWKPFISAEENYLEINSNPEMKSKLSPNRLKFWNEHIKTT